MTTASTTTRMALAFCLALLAASLPPLRTAVLNCVGRALLFPATHPADGSLQPSATTLAPPTTQA